MTKRVDKKYDVRPSFVAMAAILAVAWFSVIAITVSADGSSAAASGYGVDDVAGETRLAQR